MNPHKAVATSVADALDTLASEIRPLVKRLARLKADAFTFVASVEGDDDWTEDEDKVDRHQQLWDDVNASVAAFQEAERKASTTISGLVGGPKFVADDGSHTQNRKKVMYGYDLDALDQAKELPWGSPVSQTYDALDFGHHFKSARAVCTYGACRSSDTIANEAGWDSKSTARFFVCRY